MKKLGRFLLILLTSVCLFGLQSCQDEELVDNSVSSLDLKSSTMNTFYSSAIPVGNGIARAWISVNKEGEPLEVGINLSGKALTKLPDEPKQYVLTLPKNKGQNFYTHVLFDWNPHGHEPEGIYDLPHFDFHFYIIPSEERMNIPPLAPPNFDTPPSVEYIPSPNVYSTSRFGSRDGCSLGGCYFP